LPEDNTNYRNNFNYFCTAIYSKGTFDMPASLKTKKQKKGVAWYIPPRLRHWLNSHAEYLSATGKETATDEMVVEWLKERLKIEEGKRDPRALERAMEMPDEE
jgi:hypothetical protein